MFAEKGSISAYDAAFFDRDGTLLHGDPAVRDARKSMIERWSGKPLDVPDDLFFQVLNDRRLLTVENEIAFWKEYFAALLRSQGVTEQLTARANELFDAYWLKGIVVYPEVVSVLDWLAEKGFRMGVVSDTFPSLPLTIEAAGLGKYFSCYVCSDQEGAFKPDPRMYQTALDALGVSAKRSLYVDDYDVEADGARNMGFTAFHICRGEEPKAAWDVATLNEMVAYLK